MTDRTVVDGGYNKLLDLWNQTKTNNNTADCLPNVSYGFWHAGNTLDTFMDYLGRARPAGYEETARTLADDGVAIFKEVIDVDPTTAPLEGKAPTTAWFDDYGWWGIAFLKVHFLTADAKYLHAAQVCWYFMNEGARNFPVTSPGQKGGTWNHDPQKGGVQNVITNAVFLILSARLYTNTLDQQYLDGARAQYGWFSYQLANGAAYSVSVGPPAWLIRQLPLEQNMGLWTGDQGSLLGGLSSFRQCVLNSDPALAADLQSMCEAIIWGLKLSDLMTWTPPWAPNTKVMHEAIIQANPSDAWRFDLNGSVGKGVVLRYVGAYLLQRTDFIDNNAAAVSHNWKDGSIFPFSWVGDPNEIMNNSGCPNLAELTQQCSGQDAVNAWLLPTS